MAEKYVITISRQFASMGRSIAKKLAEELGIEFYDRDIVEQTARRMGLPVRRFVCASNANDVLTDFIRTGVYDRRRDFYTTISPSMDILISSNLERMLYYLCGEDTAEVRRCMTALSADGVYEISDGAKQALGSLFAGGMFNSAMLLAGVAYAVRALGLVLGSMLFVMGWRK